LKQGVFAIKNRGDYSMKPVFWKQENFKPKYNHYTYRAFQDFFQSFSIILFLIYYKS